MSDVLGVVSEFTVQDTSAELRHEFCALWNQIALEARSSNGLLAWFILRRIRNVYIGLHRGTHASPTDFTPSTGDQDRILRHQYAYPLCRIHDPLVPSIPHDNSPLPPAPLDSSPNIAPSAGPALLPTTFPAISPDPATAGAIRQEPSLGTIPRTTLVPRHNADLRDSSDAPDFPSPRFLTEIHGTIIPMRTWLTSSEPPATRSDRPHSLMIATAPLPTSSPAPPQLMHVPHSGAIAEGDSNAMAALRRDKDRLDLPLMDPAITGATLHDPLRSPSFPPVTDIAVAGPSQCTLSTEHARDPPHPSHGQYNIV
ncbi:hypothetical protein EDB84DRAFT_1485346 [Lactarius hengduanensis]|nr:hypothetical protein EDB84DRAFT_1485346 [Lactarius hengduanensis]